MQALRHSKFSKPAVLAPQQSASKGKVIGIDRVAGWYQLLHGTNSDIHEQ